MTLILWKIIIVSIFLAWTMLCIYLARHTFKLKKSVELLRIDRNELIEKRERFHGAIAFISNKEKNILSKPERQMIIAALNMPEYADAINDPKTSFQMRKVYRDLKEKIKESLKD